MIKLSFNSIDIISYESIFRYYIFTWNYTKQPYESHYDHPMFNIIISNSYQFSEKNVKIIEVCLAWVLL